MNFRPALFRRTVGIELGERGPLALDLACIGIIVLWSLFVTRVYLDMNPSVIPSGREYLPAIQDYHFWGRVRDCGLCALWFGNVGGGHPALVDPLGAQLHPAVMLAVLGWGVINGSKLVLVGAYATVGVAQWWLGRVLGVGRLACLWAAGMAVVAGNLAPRIGIGPNIFVATAACTLALPPLVQLYRSGSRRDAALLGILLGFAILSKPGYIQIGFLLAIVPATVVLLCGPWRRAALLARRYVLAYLIAVLVGAPFLVPFVHFLPELAKDADQGFRGAQPWFYVPSNLVINDYFFYLTSDLGKQPFPSQYANYIGPIPLLLAGLGLWAGWRGQTRQLAAFLGVAALLALWSASAGPLQALAQVPLLGRLFAGVRSVGILAGLAVAPMLALAAIGLDRLLQFDPRRPKLLDPRWLLVIPLVFALDSARLFGANFILAEKMNNDVAPILEALHTPDAQWVNTPFGELFFIEAAVAQNLKLSAEFYRTWNWNERVAPEPVLEASRDQLRPGMEPVGRVDDYRIFAAPPGREYAAVEHPDGSRTACQAFARGGDVDVFCDTRAPGVLVVKENRWTGWRAWVNGLPVSLQPTQWLEMDVPAGQLTVQARYRPPDALAGMALMLIGIVLAATEWLHNGTVRRPPSG